MFRKIVIFLFSVPLTFAGGSFLGGLAQSQTVGEVGDFDIPQNEFVYRYQNAIENYRRRAGVEEVAPEVAQSISGSVRGELLSYYLIKAAVEQKGLHAPDSAVATEIRQTPDFQDEDGNFSPELYRDLVSDFRYYQDQVRESIGREPLFRAMEPLRQEHVRDALAAFRRQERLVDRAALPLASITTVTLQPPTDDINLYYQRNVDDYRLREEADFEYFVLSPDDFAADFAVTEDDVQAAYDEYVEQLALLQRRRASHIYMDDLLEAARVATLAIAQPDRFAALAEEHSQDAGSAAFGGDLGIVADGDLPASLNEKLFAMTVGQALGPIETEEGGYSILKLDEIVTDPVPPLADVRADMTRRARRAASAEQFEDKVEELRELAPIEIGSLVSLAVVADTSVAFRGSVYRDAESNDYPFNEELALLEAFDSLVISSRENSAPIELSDGSYLFVRAPRYQAAGVRSVAEVEGEIADILRAGYLATDFYQQLERSRAPINLSINAAPPENTDFYDDVSLDETLEGIRWSSTHTLVLALSDEGDATAIDGDDEFAAASNAGDGADEVVGDVDLDRIYAADLSYGLPAYVFIPREGEIVFYRIRKVSEGEPQASDYAVVDEMLEDMQGRLTSGGYLDDVASVYDYEFYNLPEVTAQ